MRLGDDKVAEVASEYLEDRVFGVDASLILMAISDKQLNLPEPTFHQRCLSPSSPRADANEIKHLGEHHRLARTAYGKNTA
ncbi:MAG: hypothetical protein WCF13_13380 [Stellaceae bacterium]